MSNFICLISFYFSIRFLGEQFIFEKLEFYDGATFRKREQVVLSIELCNKIKLEADEKLIIIGTEGKNKILLLKKVFLTRILNKSYKGQSELRKSMKDNPFSVEIEDKEIEILQ